MSKEIRAFVESLKSNYVIQGDGSYLHPGRVAENAECARREREAADLFERETVGYMNRGFSLVCASCVKLREGIASGLESCGVVGCKGPRSGGDFVHYVGPIPREYFHKFCLLCGAKSVRGVRTSGPDGSTWFGLCEKHKAAFDARNKHGEKEQEGVQGPVASVEKT